MNSTHRKTIARTVMAATGETYQQALNRLRAHLEANTWLGSLDEAARNKLADYLIVAHTAAIPATVAPASTRETAAGEAPETVTPTTLRQLALALHNVADLIELGNHLSGSLLVAAATTPDATVRRVLTECAADVSDSDKPTSLASALAKHPGVINAVIVTLIECTQASGQLGRGLRRSAEGIERELRSIHGTHR